MRSPVNLSSKTSWALFRALSDIVVEESVAETVLLFDTDVAKAVRIALKLPTVPKKDFVGDG